LAPGLRAGVFCQVFGSQTDSRQEFPTMWPVTSNNEPKTVAPRGRRRLPPPARLSLERLEDRTVPSQVTVLSSQLLTVGGTPEFVRIAETGAYAWGSDITFDASPGVYHVDTYGNEATYGTFTVAGDGTIGGTTGALVASGSAIDFDLTKLAAVTVVGNDLTTAGGAQQNVKMADVDAFPNSTDTYYLPAGSFNEIDAVAEQVYGSFTVSANGSGGLGVSATGGAAVAAGNTIDFDLTKLAAVTVVGTDLTTAGGRFQAVTVPNVRFPARSTDTYYLPAGTYDVNDFGGEVYGSFTVSANGSGGLGVSATNGAAVATGNTIDFDLTKLAAVTVVGTDLTTATGRVEGSTSLEDVDAPTSATDTYYLPVGTYYFTVWNTTPAEVYGTFTVSANGSGTLGVSATGGAAIATTPNRVDFQPCELNQVQITPSPGVNWGVANVVNGSSVSDVLALPDGSYTLNLFGPSGFLTATFSVGPSGLSATQLPQDAPLVTLQLVPCQDETTTTVTASVNPSLLNQPVTFTANVSVQDGDVPTGSVQFLIDGLPFGSPVTLTKGAASITTATLALGPHTVTAVYGGGGELDGSTGSTTATVLPPANLSGLVWEDFNDDGQVDFGENGIRGVLVTLTGTDDLGRAVRLTQTTDADGAYVFLNLRPGNYYLTESPPSGYRQGIDSVGTAGGSLVATDQFFVQLAAGINGLNYNFGERPPAGSSVQPGQTATVGFWNNQNGQALIKALPVVTNPDGSVTSVANWLGATLPNTFGIHAGSNNLTGQTNAYVAALFQQDFVLKGVKLDAQVLATALSVYATNATLDSTSVAAPYGFTVSGDGLGAAAVSVGSDGDAFGVANNTTMAVMDLLLATDAQSVNGVLYGGNANKRSHANDVYSAINQAGGL
jgi:hypothetical protein